MAIRARRVGGLAAPCAMSPDEFYSKRNPYHQAP